jgi:hypothetical protein
MIRITISDEAKAIAATLPGNACIWLDPGVLAKLKALRAPGESYSDVILRLATPAAAAPCPTLVFRDNGQLETRKGTRVEYEAASVGIHQAKSSCPGRSARTPPGG